MCHVCIVYIANIKNGIEIIIIKMMINGDVTMHYTHNAVRLFFGVFLFLQNQTEHKLGPISLILSVIYNKPVCVSFLH